jgi:adenylylsulfate kinase-like enzyme
MRVGGRLLQRPDWNCWFTKIPTLKRKARRGEFSNFTGIDSPYESPESPELVVNTVECSADEAAEKVIAMLQQRS